MLYLSTNDRKGAESGMYVDDGFFGLLEAIYLFCTT